MNTEVIYRDFRVFNNAGVITRIEIDLVPSDRNNRYNVMATIHNEAHKPVNVFLGQVEKNEFQPQASEKISQATIEFFEETFLELWELAKGETDTIDARYQFIKNRINSLLLN